jgi:hypothetical protein
LRTAGPELPAAFTSFSEFPLVVGVLFGLMIAVPAGNRTDKVADRNGLHGARIWVAPRLSRLSLDTDDSTVVQGGVPFVRRRSAFEVEFSRGSMRVLVDYDNVHVQVRRQGLLYVADRIFEAVRTFLSDDTRLEMRLYGGWYEADKLTRRAQDLTVELERFPYPLWLKDRATARLVTVTGVLAQSLEALPKKLLHATYRQRPPARQFSCDAPHLHGCTTNPCPVAALVDFINNKRCPTSGCTITPKQLLRGVGEQKLVDTMLVSDLIHVSRLDGVIAIVTSDDDIWPGIINALVNGVHLIHVRTGNDSSHMGYSSDLPGKYTCLDL